MELEWFGRYRKLVASLIFFSNCLNRATPIQVHLGDGILLTTQEWQVLESIVEHDHEMFIMSDISEMLAIPQSTLSKITKLLLTNGLIEKYRLEGNRKNVVLRPTAKGVELYIACCEERVTPLFQALFDKLEPLTDEQLHVVQDAIMTLNDKFIKSKQEPQLIKVKE